MLLFPLLSGFFFFLEFLFPFFHPCERAHRQGQQLQQMGELRTAVHELRYTEQIQQLGQGAPISITRGSSNYLHGVGLFLALFLLLLSFLFDLRSVLLFLAFFSFLGVAIALNAQHVVGDSRIILGKMAHYFQNPSGDERGWVFAGVGVGMHDSGREERMARILQWRKLRRGWHDRQLRQHLRKWPVRGTQTGVDRTV